MIKSSSTTSTFSPSLSFPSNKWLLYLNVSWWNLSTGGNLILCRSLFPISPLVYYSHSIWNFLEGLWHHRETLKVLWSFTTAQSRLHFREWAPVQYIYYSNFLTATRQWLLCASRVYRCPSPFSKTIPKPEGLDEWKGECSFQSLECYSQVTRKNTHFW